jgi:hypothetical protein
MTSSPEASEPLRAKSPKGLAIFVLLGVTLIFSGELASVTAQGGWMLDDLFSLWASEPTKSFGAVFRERILPDSNPPLYFSLLYFMRQLVLSDSDAVIAVNIAAIVLAALAVYVPSRRLGLTGLALAGIGAFILSGPVLYFASEGRSYVSALSVVFVTSWYAALAITASPAQLNVARSAVLGCLGALTHVYAALFCGSLATGLVALAAYTGRKELLKPGLALGLSACIIFGLWLSVAFESVENLSWIEFTVRKVLDAALSVKELAFGANFEVLLMVAILGFGFFNVSTRPLFASFTIAFLLFALLPLTTSFVHPIITGRYWQVGAAALPVLMVFAARLWFLEGVTGWDRKRLTAGVVASCFLVTSSALGFTNARYYTSLKPIWRGANVVRPLLSRCAPGSVHVYYGNSGSPYVAWESAMSSFPKLTGAEPELFVDPQENSTPYLSAATSQCPVLGWAEHTADIKRLNDSEVLKLMKIQASPDDVRFVRHHTGFVILRRQPTG